jgi:hypothetical protein
MGKVADLDITTGDNIKWCILFACWKTKATDTHSEYLTLTSFPQQGYMNELLCYIICTLLVLFYKCMYLTVVLRIMKLYSLVVDTDMSQEISVPIFGVLFITIKFQYTLSVSPSKLHILHIEVRKFFYLYNWSHT